MRELKVGDRIRVTKSEGRAGPQVGQCGTVVTCHDDWIAVDFDERLTGGFHDCVGKAKYGWNMFNHKNYVRIERNAQDNPRPELKVGDWIEVTEQHDYDYLPKRHQPNVGDRGVVVKEKDSNGWVAVEFPNVVTKSNCGGLTQKDHGWYVGGAISLKYRVVDGPGDKKQPVPDNDPIENRLKQLEERVSQLEKLSTKEPQEFRVGDWVKISINQRPSVPRQEPP